MIMQYAWAAVMACLVMAMLIAWVPRRWLGRTMLLWAISPLIIYVGIIGFETATRPETENVFSNALLGFSIISAILIVPWAIVCGVTLAIGLALRRVFHPRVAKSEVAHPAPAQRTAPVSGLTPSTAPVLNAFSLQADDGSRDALEWRQAHIGFSDDGLKIGGVDVWPYDWRTVAAAPLRLSHPAYPLEMHTFSIHEIGPELSPVRFAASELSNGVWGFYVPTRYPTETRALSADGSLRFEQRAGEIINGRPDAVATWAVLIEAESDRVLVDCAAWAASQITNNADGSLFLRLRGDDGEALFRIEPPAQTFRDLGQRGPTLPLSELAAAVEHARQARAHQPSSAIYRRISPDGSIRIDSDASEWGNSHWVYTPRVTDLMSGRVVLDLWGTDWDATVSYPANRCVSLDFRRYHFSGDLTIELDLAADRFRITREPGGADELPSGPLANAACAMEASGRRLAAYAAAYNASRPVWDTGSKPGPFAAWRSALVILIVAVVLICVATLLSLHFEQPAPSTILREIPRPEPFAPIGVSTPR